jgi:hypothetical protein
LPAASLDPALAAQLHMNERSGMTHTPASMSMEKLSSRFLDSVCDADTVSSIVTA